MLFNIYLNEKNEASFFDFHFLNKKKLLQLAVHHGFAHQGGE